MSNSRPPSSRLKPNYAAAQQYVKTPATGQSMARSLNRGRPGVLGGDGADGKVCCGQSRPDSRARCARARCQCHARYREPPQLRLARAPWLPDGSEDDLIVHRKGATPAGAGVLGIIPGSMGTPGYVVRGKGVAASLNSAAHGAGRRMSRTKAKETVHVGPRAAIPARAQRHAAVGRPRRSADGLQGHRRGDGGAKRSRRAAGAVRASAREDGAERGTARGLDPKPQFVSNHEPYTSANQYR